MNEEQEKSIKEFEEAVLSALISFSGAMVEILDLFDPKLFTSYRLEVAEAIAELYANSEPINILTVGKNLVDKKSKLTMHDVAILSDKVVSDANIRHDTIVLIRADLSRKHATFLNDFKSKIESEPNSLKVQDWIEEEAFKISQTLKNRFNGSLSLAEIVPDVVAEILNPQNLEGVKVGITEMDATTNGFDKGDLIIFAARPGMGKTAFALQCMLNAVNQYGKKGAFFSLEMSNQQLVKRLLNNLAEISTDDIKFGRIDSDAKKRLVEAGEYLSEASIYLDDSAALTTVELRKKCRQLDHKSGGLDFIVVDYLQLMSAVDNKSNDNSKTAEISRTLKLIAKELNCPVIALSQLSRAVDSRTDRRPVLSDLRDSGAIEQDADMVVFFYRPEYYDIMETSDGQSTKDRTLIDIAKHRNGVLHTFYVESILKHMKYNNI